jgi:hypothetical protein
MSATKSESQKVPPPRRRTPKRPPTAVSKPEDLCIEGPAPIWNEASRQAVALRLMEQLDDGVELGARLVADPAFSSPDDRVTVILTLARITNANANLGRAISQLIQVEQRRRTIIEHVETSPPWNASNFKQEIPLMEEIQKKIIHYMKVVADETFDPAIKEAEEAAKAAAAQAASNAGSDGDDCPHPTA